MSEYDHKCETRNAEPEIGTAGSSQTRRNPQVDGSGSGFDLPRVSGSGFWTGLEPNRPVFVVQTRTVGGLPTPVANTRKCVVTVKFEPRSGSNWAETLPIYVQSSQLTHEDKAGRVFGQVMNQT